MVIDINQQKVQRAAFFALNKVYLRAIQEQTPSRTGLTAQQWDIEERGYLEFAIVNPEFEVITVLEDGSQPHIIRAKNKKFLRFKKPSTTPKQSVKIPGNQAFEKDGYVFAKAVYHPGFAGRQFLQKIIDDPKLDIQFQEVFMERLFSEI